LLAAPFYCTALELPTSPATLRRLAAEGLS